jgi:hypothetical protein
MSASVTWLSFHDNEEASALAHPARFATIDCRDSPEDWPLFGGFVHSPVYK